MGEAACDVTSRGQNLRFRGLRRGARCHSRSRARISSPLACWLQRNASMFATLSSVTLRKLALVVRELLSQNAPVTARVLGLRLEPQQPACGLASLAVFSLGLLWLSAPGSISTGSAVACFLAALALRFGFLFSSFIPAGVAARLRARLGVERGYVTYAAALDLLLFTQRVSFVALVCATARAPGGFFGGALMAFGFLMVPLGAGVTVWATRVVGLEAYHYRDLFTGSRNASLEKRGPYALCRDPMYSLGPLAGYGLALLALSPIALLAAGINQALLFVFNETVEQQRLRQANRIFVETRYRYELAQSLLGFDPRQELAQRVHQPGQPAAVDASRPAA
jgi:protein-S-isoprenylcysteine O-methyltransferase Ste14